MVDLEDGMRIPVADQNVESLFPHLPFISEFSKKSHFISHTTMYGNYLLRKQVDNIYYYGEYTNYETMFKVNCAE